MKKATVLIAASVALAIVLAVCGLLRHNETLAQAASVYALCGAGHLLGRRLKR